MATTVVDFGVSNSKTEFTDSSEEDVAYAKTFWQSIQLHPPIESRLVSSDIAQRLKVAPPGKQPINTTHLPMQESEKLTHCLTRAHKEQQLSQLQHYEELSEKRNQDLTLLRKRKLERIQIEHISAQRTHMTRVTETDSTEPQSQQAAMTEAEFGVMEETADEAMRELDRFDKDRGDGLEELE